MLSRKSPISLNKISKEKHSYCFLGHDYSIDISVEPIAHSRLVLFNSNLAQQLNLDLPESDEKLEQIVLKNFAWFKYAQQDSNRIKSEASKTFFATRYLDSDDKLEGSALGDGRVIWFGEIINTVESGQLHYFDVVLKGTGTTPLAWLNHPRESHKDGQVGLTEAVHEYIYSAAAKANGINAVGILAVIELPFDRQVDEEKAAIIVRVGNHLRFAHYLYFADNPTQLARIFEYGLKRDMGLPLSHCVNSQDIRDYLDLIVTNLAINAAIYFDVHAVHGSPTFGNITSNGGTIDLATCVFTDAHHSNYSYMAEGANLLGGEFGQTEQFFNLFSSLITTLKNSQFEHQTEIMPVEYFLRDFNDEFEQTLNKRWLTRIGLADDEINALSLETKERFYEIVKLLYELKGRKKIRFNQRKIFMAAFEPRKILSETARYIESFDDITIIWEQLFQVKRSWGTYTYADANPYIDVYRKSIMQIVTELKASKQNFKTWQQRSEAIRLSDRNEPGADLFYDSERFFASEEIVQQIKSATISWPEISNAAKTVIAKLADHL